MQKNDISLYSFKNRSLLKSIDFFNSSTESYFKEIGNNRVLICEFDKKKVVEINEIFNFQNEMYVFLVCNKPVSILINKNEEKNYFCLLLEGIHSFKKVFMNNTFLIFVFLMLNKILYKNLKNILILFIFVCIIGFVYNKNIVNENIGKIENNYLTQKKLYFGYKNYISQEKIIDTKKNETLFDTKITKKIVPVNKNRAIFIYNKKLIKKEILTKKYDKDAEYFLKMKNKNKKSINEKK